MRNPFLLAVGVLLMTGPALAAPDSDNRSTLSFTLENDLFAGTDRDYTNGVLFQYIGAKNDLPDWARWSRDRLGWLTDAKDWHVSYGLGQNMYTPQDIGLRNPPPDDRPYAGFLYGSAGLIANSGDQLDILQVDVGVVGEPSLAEEAQKFVHSVIGSQNPEGWDTQLENEVAFRLLYERTWKAGRKLPVDLFDLEVDFTPHVGGALGTVETYLAAGFGARIGQDLGDDFGPPRVRPALSGPGFFEDQDGFSWYLFGGLQARAVGRDLFIEGNTFRDSPGLDVRRIQGDLQAGVAVQVFRTEIAFTYVVRSPQYIGQEHFARFGSLNFRFRL